jgi:hypothetical protein
MAKYVCEVAKFDGGLNTKNSVMNLALNQSPDLLNVTFDDFGAVGTRQGKSSLTSLGSAPIDGMTQFGAGGYYYFVAAQSGDVWKSPATATTFSVIPSAVSVFAAGYDVEMFQTESKLCMVNGQTRPYKWDGTYFTHFGPSAPMGVPAVTNLGASGLLTGSYHYVFTGINSWSVESDYGSATSTYSIVSGQILLTGIPSYPLSAGVNEIGIYRNSAGVSDLFYRVGTVANGTLGFGDDVPDSILGTTSLYPEAPLDNGVMPNCKYLCENLGYLFAAGDIAHPERLYFSQGGQNETFPSENWIDIGNGDGYPITGIASYTNSIIIEKNDGFGDGSTYMLYMPDSTSASGAANWYVVKAPTAYGGQSHKALVFFNNVLAFINKKGVYALEGANIAMSASDSNSGTFMADSKSFDIESEIFLMPNSLIPKAAGIDYKNKVWFSVPTTQSGLIWGVGSWGIDKWGTGGTNNRIYQYDYARINADRTQGAWSIFDAHELNSLAIYEGQLYGGSATDGKIYALDVGWDDDGAAIDSYYVTAPIYGLPEHKDFVKVWRWAWVTIECYGKYFMTISYILDFESGTGTPIPVSLDGGGMIWGVGIFGVSKWGPGVAILKKKIYFRNSVSRDIQLRFSTDEIGKYWKVHKVQLVYNLRSMR